MKFPDEVVDAPIDIITHGVAGLPEVDMVVLYIEDSMDIIVRSDTERERTELRCTSAGLVRLAAQVQQARIAARTRL